MGKGKGGKKRGRQEEEDEAAVLAQRVVDEAPERGTTLLGDVKAPRLFTQLPISERTLKGLKKGKFLEMTDIQQAALPHALAGRDVLGSARTGSGKTISFVIPILETLFRANWTNLDGLGAIVISPTRELSMQIFNVLKVVGSAHSFSAGLVIGGKDKDTEGKYLARMNILVATPGRLLHHLETTPDFSCDSVQVVALDEADRILDLGFEKTLNAIVDYLPRARQTLLFSATQTKSVKDLARLSLNSPEWVFVHDKADTSATPRKLAQSWTEVPLPGKIDVLWSFLKSHLKAKVLVFLTSCKQVKFVHEVFCKQRPGTPLLCLHGKQKQTKRMEVFDSFCNKQHAVLFATDLAARGLDFPAVDWVVQVDCPEDVAQYIHRAGRTARYRAGGKGLLFLAPSEREFVQRLQAAQVPIKSIHVDPRRTVCLRPALQAALVEDPELKHTAQRAFVSYVRAVFLRKDKEVFDVSKLPLEEFAASLGLPNTPRVRFVARAKPSKDNLRMQHLKKQVEEEQRGEAAPSANQAEKPKTKMDKLVNRKNTNVLSEGFRSIVDDHKGSDADSDDESEDAGSDESDDEEEGEEERPKKKVAASQQEQAGDKQEGEAKAKGKGKAEADDKAAFGLVDEGEQSDGSTGGVLVRKKRPLEQDPGDLGSSSFVAVNKRAKIKATKANKHNKRLKFDEDGNPVDPLEALAAKFQSDKAQGSDDDDDEAVEHRKFVVTKRGELDENERLDKQAERERVRNKHLKQRVREKEMNIQTRGGNVEGGGVELAPMEDDEAHYANDSDGDSDESESKFRRPSRHSPDASEGEGEDEDEDEGHNFEDAARRLLSARSMLGK